MEPQNRTKSVYIKRWREPVVRNGALVPHYVPVETELRTTSSEYYQREGICIKTKTRMMYTELTPQIDDFHTTFKQHVVINGNGYSIIIASDDKKRSMLEKRTIIEETLLTNPTNDSINDWFHKVEKFAEKYVEDRPLGCSYGIAPTAFRLSGLTNSAEYVNDFMTSFGLHSVL